MKNIAKLVYEAARSMTPRFSYVRLVSATLLFSQSSLVGVLPLPVAGSTLKISNLLAQAPTLSEAKSQADRLNENGRQQLDKGQLREALQTFEQVLLIRQEIGDKAGVAETLNKLGEVYNNLGQSNKALEVLEQSLAICREAGDRAGEGEILYNIGESYSLLSQYDKALEILEQSLAIRQEVGDRQGEGRTLQNMGVVYVKLGQYSQALELYQQALEMAKAAGDRIGEGRTLNSIGLLYNRMGQYSQSLEFLSQSLKIRREIGARLGEGGTLNNLGLVYARLGQYPKAIESFEQALEIARTIGDRPSEGNTLTNMGGIYDSLGQYKKALYFYEQAIPIRQEIGDKAGLGNTFNNIALVYTKIGEYPKALEFYTKALAIRQEIGDRPGEGRTLHNIAGVYDNLHQYSQALKFYQQALAIRKEIGDRPGEAATLNNRGLVYKNLGQYPQAIESYQQGLGIFKEMGDRPGERIALSNIGHLLTQQNKLELAIVFYKQSVNLTEAIRKDLQGLPPDQQKSYTETVAEIYRTLADLLLKQNRVLEAQQVLDLLKVQELEDYLRNVRGNEQISQSVELLPKEQLVEKEYTAIQDKAIERGKELTELRKIPENERSRQHQQRIAELEKIQQEITQEFNEFIKSPAVVALTQKLNETSGGESLNLGVLNRLRTNLQRLQQKAVIVYPLILEDRLEIVLVTPDAPPIHRTVPVKREELNQAIVQFRTALTHPRMRSQLQATQATAHQLYNFLIKPIENDLTQAKAETIVYAPDGQLRYIPLAALYDGKQWLVQRFRINNITAASLTDFNPKTPTQPRVLAGAFAQGSYSFEVGSRQFALAGLPFAAREVETLATTIPGTTKLLDGDFTPAATIPRMNDYNIIHLATHAAFLPGQPEDSFIMFGNGDRVTLRDIETWSLSNVDLVVLSACQTAVGGIVGNGEEILGLGYQMQLTGARAVIASLWSVDDGGTQSLMNSFYAALQKGNITKAEALHQAQIALIGDNNPQSNALQGLAHPYYWAPFILIGNGL